MTTYSKDGIASSIRAARAKRRLTQEQLADAIGVDMKTVCSWENSNSGISLKHAWAIADFFDEPIGPFFGRDEESV